MPHRFAVSEVHERCIALARDDEDAGGADVVAQIADVDGAGDDQRVEAQRVERLAEAQVAAGEDGR